MQKLITKYTFLYIILIFCSTILQIIPGIALLREGYILFLFFACLIYLVKLRLKKISFLIIIYILCNFISYRISSNPADALSSFILYISGPLIFILLTCIPLTEKTINNIDNGIKKLFVGFILIALILFPVQKQFYSIFGIDKSRNFINLYRFTAGGGMKFRLSGLCAHPTTMGAICLFILIDYFFLKKNKESISVLIPYYLSDTRSILLGTPFVWYAFLPPKKKFFVTILVPLLVIAFVFILLNSVLDPSALIHFADLLENGPKLLFGNISLFGNGHGTMSPFTTKSDFIHVESDLYIAIMQIGIIGILLYLIIIAIFIHILKKDNNQKSKYCAAVCICVNIGCIVLSYYAVRFLSNYMWIELGLYFSSRRYLCKK